jgi:protein-disulfide isomerase
MSRRDTARRSGRTANRRRTARRSIGMSITVVSLLAVGAAIVAIVALTQSSPQTAPSAAGPSAPAAGLVTPSAAVPDALADGTTLGRPDAPVTLEVWSDYQCPYCGELARNYLPRVARDFVASGEVRIVAQDIAFLDRGTSRESTDAATAAACAADQEQFWSFHDLLMWNQAGENRGAFAPSRLDAMARRLGLDTKAWNACRVEPRTSRALRDRVATAGTLGIVSTPTLVIDGRAIVGLPPSYDALAAALRAALATHPSPP